MSDLLNNNLFLLFSDFLLKNTSDMQYCFEKKWITQGVLEDNFYPTRLYKQVCMLSNITIVGSPDINLLNQYNCLNYHLSSLVVDINRSLEYNSNWPSIITTNPEEKVSNTYIMDNKQIIYFLSSILNIPMNSFIETIKSSLEKNNLETILERTNNASLNNSKI